MGISYDPKNIPQPINEMQVFLNAILVELRAIRIALQEQNNRVNEANTPVVPQQPRKRG